MGNAMPTANMMGAMQMIANRLTDGHHDMHTRLADMDADGLACEIIFHGSQNGEPIPFITPHDLPAGLTTPFTFEGLDLDLAYAGMHMYNEWLADQCSIEPERHVGLAYIPAWDPAKSRRRSRVGTCAWPARDQLPGVAPRHAGAAGRSVGAAVRGVGRALDAAHQPRWCGRRALLAGDRRRACSGSWSRRTTAVG